MSCEHTEHADAMVDRSDPADGWDLILLPDFVAKHPEYGFCAPELAKECGTRGFDAAGNVCAISESQLLRQCNDPLRRQRAIEQRCARQDAEVAAILAKLPNGGADQ